MPLGAYKELILFFALVASGDIVLVPLIYSVKFGFIRIGEIFFLVIAAAVFTDSAWYIIGRKIRKDRIEKLPILRGKPHVTERISKLFDSKGAYILFASKFIYGTRSVTQVLCGVHRMPYITYFASSIGGTILWTAFLVAVISLVDVSLSSIQDTAVEIQMAAALVIAILAALHYGIKRKFRAWFRD